MEKISKKIATRASRKESLSTVHKSAISDHVADKNHVIDWKEAKVIGTEENKRWIKEAVEIRKRRGMTMNRDEGQYQLSHLYDEFLVSPGKKSPGKRSGNTTTGNGPGNVAATCSSVSRTNPQSLV